MFLCIEFSKEIPIKKVLDITHYDLKRPSYLINKIGKKEKTLLIHQEKSIYKNTLFQSLILLSLKVYIFNKTIVNGKDFLGMLILHTI